MAEEVSTTPDNSATIAEKVEKPVENVEKTVEKSEEVAPKKKGRPAGAKDKAPRVKKPRVVVVEEPLEAPPVKKQTESSQPPAVSPAAPLETPRTAVHVAPEIHEPPAPPSPRTVMREASRHILELKRLESSARRTHLGELYGSRLHTFVR
jgi:hypothetical protein